MGALSVWHWAIVAVVVVILFGSKKLPEAARGLGRSLRIFKSEVKEMQNDGKTEADVAAPSQLAAPSNIEPSVVRPPVAQPAVPQPSAADTHRDAKSA